jgi:hypothetical protein
VDGGVGWGFGAEVEVGQAGVGVGAGDGAVHGQDGVGGDEVDVSVGGLPDFGAVAERVQGVALFVA